MMLWAAGCASERASDPARRPEPAIGWPDARPASPEITLGEQPEAGPECRDELGSEPCRLTCDGTRIMVQGAIELDPARARPAEPSRRLLGAVGALLRDHPEILLLRIEVGVGKDVGSDSERRRAALVEAQRRADALLDYLWRREAISAERLEAVAYPFAAERQDGTGWPVVLRVVQHAEARR